MGKVYIRLTERNTKRFLFFGIITAVLVLLVVWRYFNVMVLSPPPSNPEISTSPHIERGPILDRKGRILAIQTRLDSVTAWRPSVIRPEEEAELLGSLLGLETSGIREKFDSRSGFMYIKRKISPTESRRVQDAIDAGRLPGIDLSPEYGRNYPEKDLAAHVIGFAGTDNVGLDGIELEFNDTLFPEPEDGADAAYGDQVFLTIDVNVQYLIERITESAYEEHKAEGVIMIVLDADTAEVLAYASAPDYDVNTFNVATPEMKKNRPVTYLYEPGSVLKVFTIASMLQIGGISKDQHYYCDGIFTGHGEEEPIRCLGVHGDISTGEILKYSCNDGAASASEFVEEDAFYDMLRSFGFGSPTGIPLPGEAAGILREPAEWSARTKPTIAIGQEISVTALQLASAATVFANEGYLLRPTIIKKIISPDGKIIREFKREAIQQVVSAETADDILLMMESATRPDGTAHRAGVSGIRVSAKTGTAEIFDPDTGSYSDTDFVASCLSLVPTDDPALILYAIIAKPSAGEYLGGRIAAPMVREAIEELTLYYGLPTGDDTLIGHSGTVRVESPRQAVINDRMPDFTGYSKRELLPLLARTDLKLKIQGEGWVVRQEPRPGVLVTDDTQIILELE